MFILVEFCLRSKVMKKQK